MSMELTKSTALVHRRPDSELMPPPPKRIKRPKNVIDEESYTDAISEIIARDFFPGLLESETQQEYLDALESRDGAWIASASRRLAHVMTPGRRVGRRGTSLQTPIRASDTPRSYAGDTPASVVSDATVSTQATATKIDTNMSLDKFQSLYTSEDNESFYKLIDKQNQKRAEKYAWMWRENKLPSKMMLKQKEVETKLLESGKSLIDDGGKKDRLAIQDANEKSARPDAWKSKPNNELMFRAEGVEDTHETVAQKAQNDSRAPPKAVSYNNTRFQPDSVVEGGSDIPPSPSLSAVRDAIAGQRRMTESESGISGAETPRVNGYAFVDDEEPEPEPSIPSPTINLGKGEAVKNPFIIKEQSRREALHHRMVDKNAQSKRASSKIGMTGKVEQTPVPKFPSSPRVGSGQLTPAAQRLWSRVGNNSGSRTPSAFGVKTPGTVRTKSGLRSGWTPSGKP
ncbi:nuclear protein DGCR14 [Xylogone sp. PMI_703]|nr:nuclear protein DGCR14 [Xylogone sp. PMI_703]